MQNIYHKLQNFDLTRSISIATILLYVSNTFGVWPQMNYKGGEITIIGARAKNISATMEETMKKCIFVLVLLLFAIATPLAFADEEIGEVACAMKSKAPIPPGQFARIAKYADEFFSGPGRTIFASTFTDGINDPENPYDDLSDFFVLDIRSASDYAIGHIPGAVNVPFALVAKPENLVDYPTDKPILVVCYSGQTAAMTTSILNVMGYDAFSLRFGMMSWNAATNMKIYSPGKPAQTIYGGGYPLEQ